MAAITDNGSSHNSGAKAKRKNRSSTRVDMTPMVDLAFLLLTFFVLTATFSKPKVMSLVYPAKAEVYTHNCTVSNAITFLLSRDRIFYYAGAYHAVNNPEGKPATTLREINFGQDGLRKLLADMNGYVLREKELLTPLLASGDIDGQSYKSMLMEAKKSGEALKVLVKTDDQTTCENFVDLIDELKIAEIGVIAPVDIMPSENVLLQSHMKNAPQTKTAAL